MWKNKKKEKVKEELKPTLVINVSLNDLLFEVMEYSKDPQMFSFNCCSECMNSFLVKERDIPKELWQPSYCPFCGKQFSDTIHVSKKDISRLDP